jgi:hypothetical protein
MYRKIFLNFVLPSSAKKDKTMKRVIYKTPDGGVAVLVPSPDYLQDHTIEELAAKDVPANTPFEIVDTTDIPTDRTFRGAWTWA